MTNEITKNIDTKEDALSIGFASFPYCKCCSRPVMRVVFVTTTGGTFPKSACCCAAMYGVRA